MLASLTGHSIATIRWAEAAGMIGDDDDAIARADVILSILPPNEAFAQRRARKILRGEYAQDQIDQHGARVLASLTGRSIATIRRAEAAGMIGDDDDAIARADVILSILPPNEAFALAERFAVPLSRTPHKAIFADCNAINVETVFMHEARAAYCLPAPEISGAYPAPFASASASTCSGLSAADESLTTPP